MEFERPSVTVFDSKVNFYGASENSRLLVTTFITRLRRAAKKCKTAIMVLDHPSLSGMASGLGYSGNTAWHNAFRGRLYLLEAPEEEEKGTPGGPPKPDNRRILKRAKMRSEPKTQIELWWFNGQLVPTSLAQVQGVVVTDEAVDMEFLRLLDEAYGKNDVSAAPTSIHYAPKRFAALSPISRGRFVASMNRQLKTGIIAVETVGSKSKPFRRLRRVVAAKQNTTEDENAT